jgi:hypothetical protein
MEPINGKVSDPVVDVRRIATIRTADFISVSDSCAFAKIGSIIEVLSIKVKSRIL